MEFAFSTPAFGFLVLLIPLVWFLPSRSRDHWQSGLRSAIFLLLILALMRPVLLSSEQSKHFAVVLDQSASLDNQERAVAQQNTLELVGNLGASGDITVVQVGGTPIEIPNSQYVHMSAENRSSLSDAIETAAQAIPMGVQGSVTVISDGRSTDRHWGQSVLGLVERNIPVYTLPLNVTANDIYPTDLRASTARPNESVDVEIDVVGIGNDLSIQLLHDEEVLAQTTFDATASPTAVALTFKTPNKPFVSITASISSNANVDSDPTNNTIHQTLAVQPAFRVLYIRDQLQSANEYLQTLVGSGFLIDAREADSLPSIDLAEYDVVWLDDVPAHLLSDIVQSSLVESVMIDGLGLMVSGAKKSFGDGGYFGQLIEPILPVKIQGKQDNIDPSVGLAIILDTSGSMAGSRIELAKHIARIAVRRLQPHDRIGIVEFYGNKHWAVPMQPASTKIEIDRAIGRMKAIGGTVLYPAIQEAYYGLKNVNTRFKHIVLITDAGVEDSNYEAMVRQISKDRINVTSILVGQGGHNLIMSNIANWGQGRFYAVGNQFQLVDLILKQPMLSSPPMFKEGEFQLEGRSMMGWLADTDLGEIPPISGYAEVEKRPDAISLIEIEDTDHPLLATWQYGLGRVTALTTEPVGDSTSAWQNWTNYSELLGRVTAFTSASHQNHEIQLIRRNDQVDLIVSGAVQNEGPLVFNFEDHMADPDTATLLELRKTAPNLFEATLNVPNGEPLYIGVSDSVKNRWIYAVSDGSSDHSPETQVHPDKALPLGELATLTEGRSLTQSTILGLQDLSVSPGELSFVVTKLWPWLLLLALLTYFSELLYRRWPR